MPPHRSVQRLWWDTKTSDSKATLDLKATLDCLTSGWLATLDWMETLDWMDCLCRPPRLAPQQHRQRAVSNTLKVSIVSRPHRAGRYLEW